MTNERTDGRTGWGTELLAAANKSNFVILSYQACKQAYAEPDTDPTANITDAIICAKGNGPPVLFGPGPCGFDEGNPLVVRNGPNYEQVEMQTKYT